MEEGGTNAFFPAKTYLLRDVKALTLRQHGSWEKLRRERQVRVGAECGGLGG